MSAGGMTPAEMMHRMQYMLSAQQGYYWDARRYLRLLVQASFEAIVSRDRHKRIGQHPCCPRRGK